MNDAERITRLAAQTGPRDVKVASRINRQRGQSRQVIAGKRKIVEHHRPRAFNVNLRERPVRGQRRNEIARRPAQRAVPHRAHPPVRAGQQAQAAEKKFKALGEVLRLRPLPVGVELPLEVIAVRARAPIFPDHVQRALCIEREARAGGGP